MDEKRRRAIPPPYEGEQVFDMAIGGQDLALRVDDDVGHGEEEMVALGDDLGSRDRGCPG